MNPSDISIDGAQFSQADNSMVFYNSQEGNKINQLQLSSVPKITTLVTLSTSERYRKIYKFQNYKCKNIKELMIHLEIF